MIHPFCSFVFALPLRCALLFVLAILLPSCGSKHSVEFTEVAPGLSYTNHHVSDVPWSIHVARIERSDSRFAFATTHAGGRAVGLGTLSEQLKTLKPEDGTPVLAVNGDFYQRERDFAGDPRGLQITRGELISAPVGGACFWIDPAGAPHVSKIVSGFKVTWPDGKTIPFGLNEESRDDRAVLYTPAVGATTHTKPGLELLLEPAGPGPWLPLQPSVSFRGRIKEVGRNGNSPLPKDSMVLSFGSSLAGRIPETKAGDILHLSTETSPNLADVVGAISGGPILLSNGRREKLPSAAQDGTESYEFRSMLERHPRTAIGWNSKHFFFVEVDGRQNELSVGMTLEELADYMAGLGCQEAMNLDGGGSATFWMLGQVRNSPSDKKEREVANALVLLKREKAAVSPVPSAAR